MKKLLAPGGPLGVFGEYPVLARLAAICVCAEIAWATLIIVLQFHFAEDLLPNSSHQLIASRIATVTLAFVGCETLFKIPMGALADRYGPRRLIFFALSIAAVSPILMTQATEWYHFVPLRAVDGLGAAALWPAMSALMARAVPRSAKAAAMSVFNGAYCLGLAIGPMAGLAIGHAYGNTRVFPLCAGVLLIGLFIAWTVLRGELGRKVEHPAAGKPHMIGEDFPSPGGSILRGRPMLVRMMAIYALSQAAIGLFAAVAVPYIRDQFGISEKDLPKIIAGPALFIAILALPLGRMGDSIGRAKAVWISYIFATAGMFFCAATSLMEPTRILLSPQLVVWSLGMLLMVASYILGTPAWLGLTSLQVDDSRQAQTLSLMQTSQGLGLGIGSAIVASAGHLLTRWDHVRESISKHLPGEHVFKPHDVIPISLWIWLACGFFAFCLVATLLWVKEPPHDEHAEEIARGDQQPLEITGV